MTVAYQKEYRKNHKEQILEYNKKYRKNHKDWFLKIQRKNSLKYNFGITLEEYNKLLDKQNGCCIICHKHKDEFKKALCVDHNHITGEIRGLLCDSCNKGLGLFNDDINKLKEAIRYLEDNNI